MMKLPAATLCFCLLTLLGTTVYLGISSPVSLRDTNDTFTIQHSSTRKCLDIKNSANLSLSTCDSSRTQLWKWGSGHRLFHVDSSLCLALDVQSKTLKVVDCGSSVLLWWHCLDGFVYTVYEMGLMVGDGKVGVKRNTGDTWVRGGSQDDICHRAYQVIHTSQGNSDGAPCEFPFKYNNSWYHGCLPDASGLGLSWCATSSDYDQELKWGYCLIPEKGCQFLFSGPEGEFCYQFVSGAAVTWHEALDSCRSQGADLLSVTESDDLKSTTLLEGFDQMPERMWIGLHQLDFSQGWQWSDGSPLSVVRWEAEIPSRYFPRADCGVLNSRRNYEPESCSKRLPYICKKSVNASSSATNDPGVYKETVCVDGWVPWNGWCYKLVKNNSENFSGAQQYCNSTEGGANLASFHSIDSTEMINTHFHADSRLLNVWIGLSTVGVNSTVFKWVDQQPVTFTYWDQNQPSQPNKDNKCVFYSGQSHWWRIGSCTQKLPFMCQKKGEVNESAAQVGCRHEDGWVRHGNSCYQVNTKQVFFKDHCNMTVRNRFEQAFINSLLGKLISNKMQYFWIGLQDLKNRGQYQWMSQDGSPSVVSYTNWGFLEPERDGGCAVISTEAPLGKWEVKNCTLFQAGTICRTDLSPPSDPDPDPESELNSTASCPDGWSSRTGVRYCYKVFHEERLSRKRSWEEAWSFCQALGADLPSFTDVDEMNTLHSVVRESISDDRFFWVGLNRRNPADVSWQWSDGRPVSFDTLHHEFHEDDAYSRDCTAFKSMRNSLKHMLIYLLYNVSLTPFRASPFHCEAQLEWVCQIPRGKTPEHPEWYNPGGYHTTSVFVDGAEFWFINSLKLSFMDAELFCNRNNGNLASPKTSTALVKIHQGLRELSSSTNQKWWIGLSQRGSPLPAIARKYSLYSQFFGRCSYISYEEPSPVNHQSCDEKSSFVCEKQNVTSVEKSPLEPQPGGFSCGNSSVSFRNKCYTLMSMPAVPFKQANERCQSVRGSLVTISDQVEQDFINTLLPKIDNMERIWIGLKIRNSDPEWVDQSPVSFFNFNPLLLGMHKTIRVHTYEKESMTMCAFLINNPSSDMMGTWDYSSCSWYQDLGICQHYADKVEEPSVPQEPIQVNNHTFLLIVKKLTWFEALEECTNKSMDLASVSDTLLQSTLTVHVNRARTPMWIGLFSEDDGIHYRWTDHSHTVFSRWSSEPTSGRCVYLDTDGFWKATQCEEERGGAICHKPHMETITKPEDVAVKCPHAIKGPNWIPWRKNCYSFQLGPKRWDAFSKGQLSETCRHHHADAEILTIRNQQENEFIASQLKPFTSLVQYVWLGLFRDKDNETKWFDKTYVQYSNWTGGRPDLNAPFLAGLTTDGSWSLIKSSNFLEFKQQSIVACKLDKVSKEEYQQSVKDLQKLDSITYVVMTRRVTWSEALEECSQRGGHLASVHDQKHHEHLRRIVQTDGFPLWIGLSRQDGSGLAYEWSDGTNWDYKINSTDTLTDSNLNPHKAKCVFMNPAGELKKTSCDVVQEGAICYTTTTTTPSQRAKLKAAPNSNHCPENSDGASNWIQYGDHCYLFDMSFYNYSVYEMMEAKSICDKLDAHLLTINTKEENDFLARYITADSLITSRVWLDLKFDLQGRPVSWQDNSTLSYTNMKSKSPSTGKSPETLCAIMIAANDGGWKTVSCDVTKSRVVCKTQAKSSSSHVALGFFITALIILLLAAGFVLYMKKRPHFSSSVRYERTLDDMDTTSIITDAE